jgi:hypothetical protein
MDRYNKARSKQFEVQIDVLINQILKNLINIGSNSLEIMKKVLLENPEIIIEDERRTAAKEAAERRKYVDDNAGDVSESYREEIRQEAIRKINRRRIAKTIPELESYSIMAHNLYVRFGAPDGYSWSDFYEKEEDEPTKEKFAREAMSDELRIEFRHKTVCNIIKYSYEYWGIIKEKNIDFLASHFSTLFPNTDFSDKLEIIYGNNDAKKNYVSDEDLDIIWRFIHGTIKLCIKYMYYTGRTSFEIRKNEIVVDVIPIEIQRDIDDWCVNLDVRTDNLKIWHSVS